jgi:hypothetical protein
MSSKTKSRRDAWPGSSTLISLMPLSMPAPPRFPKFTGRTPSPNEGSYRRERGLFLGLLGDPSALYQDLLANPEKYDESLLPLVQSLVTGQRKLDELKDDEVQALDRATIDFGQPTKPVPPSPAPTPHKPTSSEPDIPYVEGRAPASPFPEDGPEPFWWLSTEGSRTD